MQLHITLPFHSNHLTNHEGEVSFSACQQWRRLGPLGFHPEACSIRLWSLRPGKLEHKRLHPTDYMRRLQRYPDCHLSLSMLGDVVSRQGTHLSPFAVGHIRVFAFDLLCLREADTENGPLPTFVVMCQPPRSFQKWSESSSPMHSPRCWKKRALSPATIYRR